MDRLHLPARLRGAAHQLRTLRRRGRTPAPLPAGTGHLHRRVGPRGSRPERADADRCPRPPGRRRRSDCARDPVHPQYDVPGPRSSHRLRHLRLRDRRHGCSRAAPGWLADHESELALGLLHQRADRPRGGRGHAPLDPRVARRGCPFRLRSGRFRPHHAGPGRHRLRADRGLPLRMAGPESSVRAPGLDLAVQRDLDHPVGRRPGPGQSRRIRGCRDASQAGWQVLPV